MSAARGVRGLTSAGSRGSRRGRRSGSTRRSGSCCWTVPTVGLADLRAPWWWAGSAPDRYGPISVRLAIRVPSGPNRSTRTAPAGSPAAPAAGWRLREGRRPADVGRSVPAPTAGPDRRGQPAGRADPVRLAGEHDQRAGVGQLVGVGQLGQGAGDTAIRSRSVRPSPAPCRSIDTNGTTPVPPPTQQRGRLAVPDEPAADRPADLERVAGLDDVGQVARHLAVVEPLDDSSTSASPARTRSSTTAGRCSRRARSAGRRSAGRPCGGCGRRRRGAARTARGSRAGDRDHRRGPPAAAGRVAGRRAPS